MKQILNIILYPLRAFRSFLIQRLLRFKAKLHVGSLRDAIKEADRLKKETKRKHLVIFNKATGQWETIQKQQLKAAHQKHKLYNRGKVDQDGLTLQRVKQIEKKSVYVT